MNRREHHHRHGSQQLDEKDQQMIQLKLALQTQITRNSLIHNRLLVALDSLDMQQLAHHDEVVQLKKSRDQLKARLTRYSKIVESTEAEKEDMRDAVLQLVQRVESAKNYGVLPYSHITLATPVEEAQHISQRLHSPNFLNTSRSSGKDREKLDLDAIAYAPSIIATLRQERDNERKAHDQTRSELEGRIWALEAMVSRRESELEFLIAQPNGETENQVNMPGSSMNPRGQQLEDDVISMLDAIVLRNRKLDSEIRSLSKKLEIARARTPPVRHSRENSTSRPSSRSTNSASTTRPSSGVGLPAPALNKANLKELEHELQELDNTITTFAAERRAIQRDLGLSNRPQYAEVAVGTDDEIQGYDHSETNAEQELDEIISHLEEVARERDQLLEENEQLRDELGRAMSQAREECDNTILARDVAFDPRDGSPPNRYRNSQSMRSTSNSMLDQHSQSIPTVDLLDSSLSEGEESMELATPLVPLVSLDDRNNPLMTDSPNPFNPQPQMQTRRINHNVSYSSDIDPASVQLPDSPDEEMDDENPTEEDREWDLNLVAQHVNLDMSRFRSPPLPSPAPSSSLPGSPAVSPTLTLANVRGMPLPSTASMELDFSTSMVAQSTPVPLVPQSPPRDTVQTHRKTNNRKSLQREWDSRSKPSTSTSPGVSHMEELLDGFGSDGHSVERETYEDN